MRLHRLLLALVLAGAGSALVSAQDAPPTPIDPHAGVPGAPPIQNDPHAGGSGAAPRERQLVTALPSAQIPAGTIRVTVVDQLGAPVAGADLNVGLMAAGAGRDRLLVADRRRGRRDVHGTADR